MKKLLYASLFLALAGCGGANYRPEKATAVTPSEALPVPSLADTQIAATEFRLGPTDKVAIRVFGVDELKADATVDMDGDVTMPLIGDVPATGKTTKELAADIQSRLGARYVRDPQVTVALVEANSQRVTLDGEVKAPGRYPIAGPTTLTQALALGQGLSDNALDKEVVVFRTIGADRYAARFSLRDIRGGRAEDPKVYGNDVIVVGSDRTSSMIQNIATFAPILSLFYLLR